MKLLIFLSIFSFSIVSQAKVLHCNTEKVEVDPTNDFGYIANDSNPDIMMALQETTVDGKKSLVSIKPQTVAYKFSQSSGGESPWTLYVDQVKLENKILHMAIIIRKNGVDYVKERLYINIDRSSLRQVYIFNKMIVENRDHILYYPSEAELRRIFINLSVNVEKQKMVLNDFVWLSIKNCHLMDQ